MRAAIVIEHHKLALKEDVTEDIEADTTAALNASEASRPAVVDRRVVDIRAGDSGLVVTNLEAYVGQSDAAGVGIPSLLLVVPRAINAPVVVRHDGVIDKEQRGSSISDSVKAVGVDVASTNGVAGASERPEALAVVDIDVGDVAGMCAVVDGTKAVGAGLAFLEVGGEERGREAGFDVVEEGQLLVWLNGIDGGEGETEEAVIAGVLLELVADFLGELDGLAGKGGGADCYGVGVDDAAGGAAIAVGDVPGRSGQSFGGIGLGRVVGIVAIDLVGRSLGREDPSIHVSIPLEIESFETTHRSEEPVSKSSVSC